MKRLIVLSTVILLVLSAVSGALGCQETPTPAPVPTPTPEPTPSPTISWDEGKYHIGERTTVCGPVVSTTWASGSKGKPTFLNIGKPYPEPGRFTVVIWIQDRGNFSQPPEDYYYGKNICVTGLIIEYKGVPEIEVKDASQIREQ